MGFAVGEVHMSSLSAKLANVKMPFEDVTICLDGEVAKERQTALATLRRVTAQVAETAKGKGGDTRLVGSGLKAAKKAVEEIEARAKSASITLRITGVPFGKYNKFVIQNPPRKGKDEQFNTETFFMFVARRTGQYVEDDGTLSEITDEQWDEIEEALTDGEHDKLAQAVFMANRQDSMRGIDFLSSNSETTTDFSEISEQPEHGESPTAD